MTAENKSQFAISEVVLIARNINLKLMNGTDNENVTYAVANAVANIESSVNSYMGRCPKDSI